MEKIKIIASFISIKTEISTEPLNDYFFSLGKKVCLPVILNNNKHLIFRSYDKKTILKKGKFGILEPDKTKKEISNRSKELGIKISSRIKRSFVDSY